LTRINPIGAGCVTLLLVLSPGAEMSSTDEAAVSRAQRQHMIEEAAYYRAQQRGFAAGDPMRDWLDAETEIDRMLTQQSSARLGPIEQFETQLRAFDADLQRLKARARDAGVDLRAQVEREVQRLQPVRAAAEEKLNELRERSSHAVDEVLRRVNTAREEMANTLQRLSDRLR
jgi:hypothetical protein